MIGAGARGASGALLTALALLASMGGAMATGAVLHGTGSAPATGHIVTVSAAQARRLPGESVDVGRRPHGRRRPAGFLSM